MKLRDQPVGTFGEIGVLSFYGNKTITTGEGGVILTDDDELAKACYRLKNHGRDAKGIFLHETIGFNFSFTEMQAAIGVAQLEKLPRIISRKAEINRRYREGLGGLDAVGQFSAPADVSPVHWFTSILVDDPESLSRFLGTQQIQTRRFFYPLHLQPCYSDWGLDSGGWPNSTWAFDHGLSLPSSFDLTEADQDRVIEAVKEFFRLQ